MIGKTVSIFNRRFLIYDCDNFTKAFYWKNFEITDFSPLSVDHCGNDLPKMVCVPVL